MTARGPAYRIVTPRLVLRCWNPEDAPLLTEAIGESLEELRPWMPWVANEPETLAEKTERLRQMRARFDRGEDFPYGVLQGDERRALGGTGLHPRVGPQAIEIGYWIRTSAHRQGLATEAAGALVRVAFEVLGLARVEIHCDPRNERSAAIPRRLGFEHEATLKQRIPSVEGPLRDSMIWSLFAEDYPKSPAAERVTSAFDAGGRRLL
jgi:RimJ/RimL family protein N-acetyltransferase